MMTTATEKTWQRQVMRDERTQLVQSRIDTLQDMLDTATFDELYKLEGVTAEMMKKAFAAIRN